MKLAKVVGTVVATRKDETLVGYKLLVVKFIKREELNGDGESSKEEELVVAVDSVGAGIGETVLVVSGSVASRIAGSAGSLVDATVVGIVDEVELI